MPTPAITPVARTRDLPLSFAQQRLWFLHKLDPDSTALNISAAFRIKGALDNEALARSLDAIIRRHEALRTRFPEDEEGPVQAIDVPSSMPLSVTVLDEPSPPARERRLHQLMMEQAQRSFDLATGPLVRTALFRLADEEHVLQLVLHHTISDGWSMGIIFRELGTFYEAFSTPTPPSLPELPVQYADYAVWQRKRFEEGALSQQRSYWMEKLDGAPTLELPLDYSRPVVLDHQGARTSMMLSQTLTDALNALGRQEGVTLFITLLAVLKVLLYRYTHQTDIVVGAPISGRLRPEIQNAVGCFINTLPLRTDLSGNPSFRALLGRVRSTAFEAYAHQELSFEKLVEDLHPERDLSRHPLFDVMLNFRDASWRTLTLPGLRVRRMEEDNPTANVAINLYVNVRNGQLCLDLVYQQALFSAERMACMTRQLRSLLEQIVADPEKRIRSYSLVTPDAYAVLPDPHERLDEPPQVSVPGQFAAWTRKTPHHPAIRQGGNTWSYDQLADRSETLGRRLRTQGITRGDIVAVHGPPCFGLIASMIGVLQSGGVLLPIDPHLPSRRKQRMLREAQARHLVCIDDDRADHAWLDSVLDVHRINVDPIDGYAVDPIDTDGLDSDVTSLPTPKPDDPAYIFFTSGTTGTPKGILGCHKSLSHFLNWQRTTFAIGPDDRVAQLTSLSFDVILRDIFLPLTSGATLCLPQGNEPMGPENTIHWLAREQISVLHTVPTRAQFWLTHAPEDTDLPHLRWVFFAGEPLTDALVRQWRRAFPRRDALVNLYGPTETTMVKCFYPVPDEPPPGVQPAGRPLPHTQALVLTPDHNLCGIGEPGEIVLRTPFRTLGYINAPKEDQQRFAPNPFRHDEHDVVYYTGDRGRYRPDGTLDILGRLDDQVKIRGVRIEPGEITAVLMQHPEVTSCFVEARKDDDQQPYLVAYVVPSRLSDANARLLRSYLRERLLEAMIPSAFVFLKTLPLTTNGKVDRTALPAPDASSFERQAAHVAPGTPIEKTITEIWAEVLNVEPPGIHANFFALGGHSLVATQIIARISNVFDVELSLPVLFNTPTIAELAGVVLQLKAEQAEWKKVAQALSALDDRPDNAP